MPGSAAWAGAWCSGDRNEGIDGSVLSISGESEIQDVYRYTDGETVHELARWRVRLFSDRQHAEEFAVSHTAT